MIYTELTKRAMVIAYKAHLNQFDKSGLPYIYHPIHLAEQMKDETTTIIALLHDVIEDTNITLEDLKKEGFSSDVLDALYLMAHDKNTPYMDYILLIKKNPYAKTVKLADLEHNSDMSRLNIIGKEELDRVEKYKKAIEILKSE